MIYNQNGVFRENGFPIVEGEYNMFIIEEYLEPVIKKSRKSKFEVYFTSAVDYSPSFIYSDYEIQNHLEVEKNFPAEYYVLKGAKFGDGGHKGDMVYDVYTDRLTAEQRNRIKHIAIGRFDRQMINPDQLIELSKLLFNREDISGARIVRFTNVATGYPVWRIDAIVKSPITPKSVLHWEKILSEAMLNPYSDDGIVLRKR